MLEKFRKNFIWVIDSKSSYQYQYYILTYKISEEKGIYLSSLNTLYDRTNDLVREPELFAMNLDDALYKSPIDGTPDYRFSFINNSDFIDDVSDEEWLALKYYMVRAYERWNAQKPRQPIAPTAPMAELFQEIIKTYSRPSKLIWQR